MYTRFQILSYKRPLRFKKWEFLNLNLLKIIFFSRLYVEEENYR
jgi:hypothetical protein